MTDLEILNAMINDSAKVQLLDNQKSVKLTEPQSSNSSVIVHGLPETTIVIKADAFRSPDTFFQGTKGECKRADFVIIAEKGDQKVIVCIELKSKKGSRKEIVQQLTGAKCMISYCREIGNDFWKESTFLSKHNYRFVSFSHTSNTKNPSRIKMKSELNDSPEKMLMIQGHRRIQFSQIAAMSK